MEQLREQACQQDLCAQLHKVRERIAQIEERALREMDEVVIQNGKDELNMLLDEFDWLTSQLQ